MAACRGITRWPSPTQVGALPAIADIRGLPVVDQGRVFAISHSGRMAAIDHRTGDSVWEADIGGIDTPIVAGDTVFIYGGDGQLMALSRDSGRMHVGQATAALADPSDKNSDRLYGSGPVLAGREIVDGQFAAVKLSSFSPATARRSTASMSEARLYSADHRRSRLLMS